MLKKENLKYAIAVLLLVAIAFLGTTFVFGGTPCPIVKDGKIRCNAHNGKVDTWCGLSMCVVSRVKENTPGLIICNCD